MKRILSRPQNREQVDAAYYGYGPDEEDEKLLEYEAAKEREAFAALAAVGPQEPPAGWVPLPGDSGDGIGWDLPSPEEVMQELLERKKKAKQ